MIHGSRASGAARPLSCSPPGPCLVCRSELAIHAPVNAAGPAMPAAAPSRNTARREPLTTTPLSGGSCAERAHGDHTESEAGGERALYWREGALLRLMCSRLTSALPGRPDVVAGHDGRDAHAAA